MDRALWISKTGLEAQQTKMAVISNNLANVSTTGFKKGRAIFEDLLYQNVRQAGGQTSENTYLPSGLMLGSGVRTVATEKIHTQGNSTQTDNSTDLAIVGRGFFQILMPDGGIAYTRDGGFKLNAQGSLVTSSGHPLQPALQAPPNALSITIGSDGVVTAAVPGTEALTQVGTVQIADFVNPSGLQSIGENLYKQTVASGAPLAGVPGTDGLGTVQQGALESSNVSVVSELVDMIETQRAYEMNSKSIQAVDGMLRFLTNNL